MPPTPGQVQRMDPTTRMASKIALGYYRQPPGAFYVYALRDPQDGFIRYVGSTQNIHQRFKAHRKLWQPKGPKGAWLIEMRKTGVQFEFIILERVADGVDYYDVEFSWIRKLRAAGHPLFNIHPKYGE